MIETQAQAARLAMSIAGLAYSDPEAVRNFEEALGPHAEHLLAETLAYRFAPEAFYIHNQARGIIPLQLPWAEIGAQSRLAFTLYAEAVPLLARFIAPRTEQQAAAGAPAAGRGFDSVFHDDSNRGTIYEREDFAKPAAGAAAAAAKKADQPSSADDRGGDMGPDSGAAPSDGAAGIAAMDRDVAVQQVDIEQLIDQADSPANPKAIVTDIQDGAFAEVVEDDDADDGDDAAMAEPAPPMKRARRKA